LLLLGIKVEKGWSFKKPIKHIPNGKKNNLEYFETILRQQSGLKILFWPVLYRK